MQRADRLAAAQDCVSVCKLPLHSLTDQLDLSASFFGLSFILHVQGLVTKQWLRWVP